MNYDKESEIERLVTAILQESISIDGIKFKVKQDYQGGSLKVIFGNADSDNIEIVSQNRIWFSSDSSISKPYSIWVYNHEYPNIADSAMEDICFELSAFMDEFYEATTKQSGFSEEV